MEQKRLPLCRLYGDSTPRLRIEQRGRQLGRSCWLGAPVACEGSPAEQHPTAVGFRALTSLSVSQQQSGERAHSGDFHQSWRLRGEEAWSSILRSEHRFLAVRGLRVAVAVLLQ